ncbi:MAG: tRNA pseudouridine(55) synthase TruB [Alphaproteobacteria bacterium]|nr:tRNA pseudouridine(55) synthase TruB [Alphaproteobacteria bacterium]MDD9920119.1 tRNA pseudouridine(55) synthase TruB [Alphaproteobacteria bacterium]
MQKPVKPEPNRLNGWLNFNKPVGMTSAEAVGYLKRTLNVKKIGHGGTLDPLADGVLPIAIGVATKTMQFTLDADKTYEFTITFGQQTTTDDAEGEVLYSSDKRPIQAELEKILPKFTGKVSQLPPNFSALKVNGQRAHKLARSGQEVKLEARSIIVYTLELLEFTEEAAVLRAKVSKGTYIRSLARDIGGMLGCYGYVTTLKRTQAGAFSIKNSVTPQDVDNFVDTYAENRQISQTQAEILLQPVDVVLADIPVYIATPLETTLIRGGKVLRRIHLPAGKRQVHDRDRRMVSLIEVDEEGDMHIIRNFE